MIRINLLPRVPRRRLPGREFIEYGLPLLTLAVVIVLWVMVGATNSRLEAEKAKATKERNDLQPVVARVLELDRQIAIMRDREKVIAILLGQQLPAAAILNEFRLLIPKEVWATSLSVPEPSAINVEGMALNYYAVAQLMDNLAAGQLFRLVDLSLVQIDRIGPKDVVKFSVTARIQKPQPVGGERP